MGIASKHAYRFSFLNSEQWKTVRIEALAREDGKCQICKEFSISNDAHHIIYPRSFWDTKSRDLVILCRLCHQLMHDLPVCDVSSVEEAIDQFTTVSNILREWLKQHGIKSKFRKSKGGCFACRTNSANVAHRELFPDKPNDNSQWPFCDECWSDIKGQYKTFSGARKLAEMVGQKKNS